MIFFLSLFLWRKLDSPRPYLVKPRTCLGDSSSRTLSGGWEEVPRTLRKCLKNLIIIDTFLIRNDFRAVKAHSFFHSINWADLEKKRLTPPFKPQLVNDTDTRWNLFLLYTSAWTFCIFYLFQGTLTPSSLARAWSWPRLTTRAATWSPRGRRGATQKTSRSSPTMARGPGSWAAFEWHNSGKTSRKKVQRGFFIPLVLLYILNMHINIIINKIDEQIAKI